MGPGENAGVVDVGRRARGGLQGRVAQPPERGRAVPGRGHRGRGHPARRLRGRGAADRGARLPALRRARLAALALPVRLGGQGHRPLRQLDRRADRRRRGVLRARLRAELPRQRDVRRAGPARAPDPQRRRGSRQPARPARSAHRARRDRGRLGARQRRAGRRRTPPSGPRSRSAIPFEESKLVECCLELLEAETLASLQDLGAAGLSSSSSEMASKGEVGLDIDVSRVPLREADMEPFEIMISESQERMLCVVEPERLGDAARGVRALGRARDRDRRRHRHAPAARVRRRRAGGRHAGRGAGRRLPAL